MYVYRLCESCSPLFIPKKLRSKKRAFDEDEKFKGKEGWEEGMDTQCVRFYGSIRKEGMGIS